MNAEWAKLPCQRNEFCAFGQPTQGALSFQSWRTENSPGIQLIPSATDTPQLSGTYRRCHRDTHQKNCDSKRCSNVCEKLQHGPHPWGLQARGKACSPARCKQNLVGECP